MRQESDFPLAYHENHQLFNPPGITPGNIHHSSELRNIPPTSPPPQTLQPTITLSQPPTTIQAVRREHTWRRGDRRLLLHPLRAVGLQRWRPCAFPPRGDIHHRDRHGLDLPQAH